MKEFVMTALVFALLGTYVVMAKPSPDERCTPESLNPGAGCKIEDDIHTLIEKSQEAVKKERQTEIDSLNKE